MDNKKGIAIRVEQELIDKIENHEMNRNDLINEAINRFFENDFKDNGFESDSIPDEIYEDVYNTLYNSEVVPLKQDLNYKDEIIDLLKKQLNEIKDDKIFLQSQLERQLELIKNTPKLSKRFRKKIAISRKHNVENVNI
jgi:hypothetical protein